MRKKTIITFTVITILIGFMLAIRYNSVNESKPRDTRDLWDLREDYMEAKEMETKLLQEIRKSDEKIAKYKEEMLNSPEKALLETLNELKKEAGLKEMKGPGITLTLYQDNSLILPGQMESYLSPEVLRKLLNELNMYGAKEISIAGQRVVNTTVIREIQGVTKIDGFPLRVFPIEIKVIAGTMEEAKKLYNRMQVSSITDSFIIDNIGVSISEPMEEIVIPPYLNTFKAEIMKTLDNEGGV